MEDWDLQNHFVASSVLEDDFLQVVFVTEHPMNAILLESSGAENAFGEVLDILITSG